MGTMSGAEDPLVRALAEIVGREHVLTDPELTAGYERDWTGRFRGRARLVVRPGSTEETAAVVRRCAEAGAAIVPQGGNTGLVGGSVPRGGEVVLSLGRMAEVGSVDETAAQVTAGAGATIAAIQDAARAVGLDYAVDLASRGSATVGGTIATNAGGMYVGRWGATRAQVVGIEAVLADGSVIARMGGLLKDNTGYDLASLLCGSEGTLGVVTRARLRLVPAMPRRAVAVLGLGDLDEAAALGARLRRELESVLALEAFFPDGAELVRRHLRVPLPFERHPGCYLLVECGGREDPAPDLAAALGQYAAPEWVVIGTTPAERSRLWRLREGHPEAIAAEGIPQKLDVTVPMGRLGSFAREVRSRLTARVPGARPILFGHIGDGNIHVNVLGADPNDERVAETVFTLAAELEGSISAEHGIGVAKVRWLRLTRSEADIAAMRAIKRALDPAGILNPGVLFPGE
jgi:FAD/FMN-containing dehydrogenase